MKANMTLFSCILYFFYVMIIKYILLGLYIDLHPLKKIDKEHFSLVYCTFLCYDY
jgi:hypothetical protein